MASAVATPLERQFGRIAGVTQMTSTSQFGSTGITLQFDLNRNIDAAARDVQAAINAARGQLPANLPSNPTYRKVNPADAPILILALTSDVITLPKMYDTADSILAQKLAQVEGVGQVFVGGGATPRRARGGESDAAEQAWHRPRHSPHRAQCGERQRPKGQVTDARQCMDDRATDQIIQRRGIPAADCRLQNGDAIVRLSDVADVQDSVEDTPQLRASPKASPPSSSSSSASPAPTSLTPWTGFGS